MPNTVDVGAIRKAGQMLGAADGPMAYLQTAQHALEQVNLSGTALTIFGMGAVSAHNAAIQGHLDNVKTGVGHLREAAAKLEQAARNWERSDLPWVVK